MALVIVVACVLIRSAAFVRWQLVFDSDEAVVGLMAKHIVEGRAFPAFFYGQAYMLAVEAWLAAPVFAIAGSSLAALRVLMVGLNVAVAVLLLRCLERDAGLRPALALVPALFFAFAAPGTTSRFMHANGGNIEPFLYILLLWMTRSRPAVAGAIFAIGLLNREFTLYGFIALFAIEARRGALLTREGLTWTGRLLRSAAGVWLLVQYLKDHSSALGPASSMRDVPGTDVTIFHIVHSICLDARSLVAGSSGVLTEHWPALFGAAWQPVLDFGIDGGSWQGMRGGPLVLAVTMIAAAVIVVRRLIKERSWRAEYDFCAYLVITGALSVAGYVLVQCGAGGIGVMRYELLSILGASGLAGWCLAATDPGRVRRAWLAAAVACIAIAASGHARLAAEYASTPPRNAKLALARALEARGVKYGISDYWLAYSLTFLAQERFVITSEDPMRIAEYQRAFEQHRDEAFAIRRRPCENGTRLDEDVYLCGPPQ